MRSKLVEFYNRFRWTPAKLQGGYGVGVNMMYVKRVKEVSFMVGLGNIDCILSIYIGK